MLDMFPYPSGAGLHVGHPEGYTATEIPARYLCARGFMLHPMGWDAFAARGTICHKNRAAPPQDDRANIANFKRQINRLGL